MLKPLLSCLAVAAGLLLQTPAHANPATGDKPLSEILRSLEQHGTATRAERERRHWEIQVCAQRGRCTEFYMDPTTGQEQRRSREITSDRLPPTDAKPMSAIAAAVEAMNLGTIRDLEFDNRRWEAEVRSASGRDIELYLDPHSAQVLRCSGRDCP